MAGTFSNDLINNTIYHVLNFEKHSNFQAAAREAAINNNFQIVLLTEDFNQVFCVETRHRISIEEAVRRGIEGGVDQDQAHIVVDVRGVQTHWGAVHINGTKYYMLLVDNEESYTPSEIIKLAEILELAMGMWNYTPTRDVTAEFIRALRRGNKSLAYTLRKEMEVRGNIQAVFSVTGLEKEACYKMLSNLEDKLDFQIHKIKEGEEIFGVVTEQERKPADEDFRWSTFCGALEGMGAQTVFYANKIRDIEGAADAFQLINEAWPFIRHIFPQKRVFTKYELALVGNCVNIALKGGSVKKNYMDLIEPFKQMNEGKGRQLLETLAIFVLDAGLNTAKTAQFISLHTNTVQYRLKRIREILGVDINEAAVIPGLMMALAMERVERITRVF